MGYRIAPPRLTLGGLWLAVVYGLVPALVAGGLLDLTVQLAFGVCTGLWCLAE
jgi:hypothetical protein